MLIIPLPFGGEIQTEGRDYGTGANVHVLDREKNMIFRAIREEFGEKPEATMAAFLGALAEILPNQSDEEGIFAFDLETCAIVGGKDFVTIVSDLDVYFDSPDDDENEVIYYDREEWATTPEEVIGAFLSCLKTEVGSR